MRILWSFLVLLFVSTTGYGHEVRPGYIEITETNNHEYAISWKQPVRDNVDSVAGLGLRPVFPVNCERIGERDMVRRTGALIEQFYFKCEGGLLGQKIGMEGLQRTITDVFVRLIPLDGDPVSLRLTAENPIGKLAGGGAPLHAYLMLGVEHFVFGYDHILFIVGLTLITISFRRLFWVVTAFTLAHSITLALSVLGIIRLPSGPVEAVIALSILFVAVEVALPHERRSYIAAYYPQAIAFGFGLIHGFGFSGVLLDIGLPRGETALALLLFNLGLEFGQLIIIGLISLMTAISARNFLNQYTEQARALSAFVIGSVASYWMIERIISIIA